MAVNAKQTVSFCRFFRILIFYFDAVRVAEQMAPGGGQELFRAVVVFAANSPPVL
jgi:hypothetical protein